MNKMNPLSNYTKIEKTYIKLPSNGFLNYENVINNPKVEIGVCARSSRDELMFNSPEALMNGQAVSKVIENCIPSVLDANKIYTPDIEAMLIAIKVATNESTYEIETKCPKCEKHGAFERDLNYLLNTMTYLEETPKITLENGLVLNIIPLTWEQTSTMGLEIFKLQKEVQALGDIEDTMTDDEKIKKAGEFFDRMARIQYDSINECILSIELPDEEGTIVTDKSFIKDWLDQQPTYIIKEINNTVSDINKIGVNDKMDVECSDCHHQWTLENLQFNPTNFFTPNS